jgi:Holliday junction resolvase
MLSAGASCAPAAGGGQVSSGQERHLQAALEEHLRATGWRFYHAWNSQHSAPGFPDVVALRGDRILAAEIKTMTGRVSREQRAWLDAFRVAGVPAYLWRLPGDWAEVGEVLR